MLNIEKPYVLFYFYIFLDLRLLNFSKRTLQKDHILKTKEMAHFVVLRKFVYLFVLNNVFKRSFVCRLEVYVKDLSQSL